MAGQGRPRAAAMRPNAQGARSAGPAGTGSPRLALGAGEVRLLDGDVLTIGAAPGNDLVAPHLGVSRAHARILRDESGALWLEDVGSRYGTKVNGRATTRVRLAHGDLIALGSWKATVLLD